MAMRLPRRSVFARSMLTVAAMHKIPFDSAAHATSSNLLQRPATVVYCAISMDGYLSRPDGSLDWLPQPDTSTSADDLGFEALQSSVDRIFMGRKTFEVASGFDGPWPYAKPLTVISSTLESVPERLRGKVTLTSEAPRAALRQMLREGVKRVYVDGGMLITSLLREDAIDEMILTTGEGRVR